MIVVLTLLVPVPKYREHAAGPPGCDVMLLKNSKQSQFTLMSFRQVTFPICTSMCVVYCPRRQQHAWHMRTSGVVFPVCYVVR